MYTIDHEDERIEMTWRLFGWSWSVVPVILATCVVTAVLGMFGYGLFQLLKQIVAAPQPSQIFPMLLVIFGLVFLLGILACMIFYHESITLNPDGVILTTHVICLSSTKEISLKNLKSFEIGTRPGHKGRTVYFIRILGNENEIRFGVESSRNKMDMICDELNQKLNQLKLRYC